MGDMAEDFRAMRDHQRAYKQSNRDKFESVLKTLKEQYTVVELTPYQYRIDGILDIYPSNKKWHLIPTNERGRFRTVEDIAKVLAL